MWSCLTEYDEDAERKFLKNEGRKEGIAEGLEKGLKKGLSEGRKEGLSEGRKMEAERMGALISRLIKEKRISDADRASTDAAYRESLYKEFKL
jgi:flagellar biosynthesis/type III secretory pathway protein FliH